MGSTTFLRSLSHGLAVRRTPAALTHLPQPKCRIKPKSTHPMLTQIRLQSSQSNMPRITQSSVWTAMIPSFLRPRRPTRDKTTAPSREWNPASFYIIIFILIGSQAIRMILLKNDYAAYTRSTDAKITLLREVIEKVKHGEKVDVEKLLGTGEEGKEREWEDVLREIEEEDSLWHQKAGKESSPQQQQAQQQENLKRQDELSAVAPKESVIPAEDSDSNKEPPKDGSSRRKLNFF